MSAAEPSRQTENGPDHDLRDRSWSGGSKRERESVGNHVSNQAIMFHTEPTRARTWSVWMIFSRHPGPECPDRPLCPPSALMPTVDFSGRKSDFSRFLDSVSVDRNKFTREILDMAYCEFHG